LPRFAGGSSFASGQQILAVFKPVAETQDAAGNMAGAISRGSRPGFPSNLKLQQPQLRRSKPDGQPTESSKLANDPAQRGANGTVKDLALRCAQSAEMSGNEARRIAQGGCTVAA
jgi:hypothetical protein